MDCVATDRGPICATLVGPRKGMKAYAYCPPQGASTPPPAPSAAPASGTVMLRKRKRPAKKTLKQPTPTSAAIPPSEVSTSRPKSSSGTLKKKPASVAKMEAPESPAQSQSETQSSEAVSKKELILHNLEVLRRQAYYDNEKFRAIAYAKAIKALKEHFKDQEITSLQQVRSQKIAGVGEKIIAKIDEILRSGKLMAAERVKGDPKVAMVHEFNKIYGIGPVVARNLVEKKGITSLQQLRDQQDTLLNEKQRVGLKYMDQFQLRIPREEMELHNRLLQQVLHEIDPTANLQVVGSFRRGVAASGDIDALITQPEDDRKILGRFIARLQEMGYLTDELGQGSKKYNGVSILPKEWLRQQGLPDRDYPHRRIDLLFTENKEFPFALLYFTGSGPYNQILRKIAMDKGYRLNEHDLRHLVPGTKRAGQVVEHPFKREEDILEFLEVPIHAPADRTTANIQGYIPKKGKR